MACSYFFNSNSLSFVPLNNCLVYASAHLHHIVMLYVHAKRDFGSTKSLGGIAEAWSYIYETNPPHPVLLPTAPSRNTLLRKNNQSRSREDGILVKQQSVPRYSLFNILFAVLLAHSIISLWDSTIQVLVISSVLL